MKNYFFALVAMIFFGSISAMTDVERMTPQDIEFGLALLQKSKAKPKMVLQSEANPKMRVQQAENILLKHPFYADALLIQKKLKQFTAIIKKDETMFGKALLFCCEKDYWEAADFLVNMGAPLDRENGDKQNIFHLISVNGPCDFYKKILARVHSQSHDLVKEMLLAKDNEGKTPFDLAVDNFNIPAIEFLTPLYEVLHQG